MGKTLILGKTTIGDLLVNNNLTTTDDVNEGSSVTDLVLSIPNYQRPYKWSVKNANQLLDDIIDAMNANREVYRVGTLILNKNDRGQYDIVDGQQRTITFSLLLRSLCKDTDIRFLDQKVYGNRYNRHNILNNFKAFERRKSQLWDDNDQKIIADYIMKQCEMIVVITEGENSLSEAFQFFDSQNARGKALYPHDLLKAYHLREMRDVEEQETEKIVKTWENLDQSSLSVLFNEYLYRIKEWVNGNRSWKLSEQNIDMFKGVTSKDNHPFAQYYKGAFAYADSINRSYTPFVTGIQMLNPFQLNAPIIAGKPFFEYAKHYFDILADIQNNDKYEGYFINGDEIVKTLDQRKYKNGVGNRITRLMFDTAILLYVDRFCPPIPSKTDKDYLDQFVIYAFIWAYSMRLQYRNVGWSVAQNYIMGTPGKEIINAFNIYKLISEADSPSGLLSRLSDNLSPMSEKLKNQEKEIIMNEPSKDLGFYENYLDHFKLHGFWEDKNE